MLLRLLAAPITGPARGLGFIFRSIHDAATAELDDEREWIRQQLQEIYALLDQGLLDEEEFDAREEALLDRLDELDELEAEGL